MKLSRAKAIELTAERLLIMLDMNFSKIPEEKLFNDEKKIMNELENLRLALNTPHKDIDIKIN